MYKMLFVVIKDKWDFFSFQCGWEIKFKNSFTDVA